MAGSVNRVILVGNLGSDPEIRSFQNGGRVANFSIATSESWKDKNTGERKERTEWHRISIVNEALVVVVERFLKKGSKVYLEGQLETRKYEKDGKDVYTTEVVLRPYRGTLTLMDGRKGDAGETEDGYQEGMHDTAKQDMQAAGFGSNPMDDEIQF
jgi:single-strand DNA-binding protein